MKEIKLSDTLTLPRIVHGMWRLMEWNWSVDDTLKFVESSIDMGVNAFDHADIYGNYSCESEFGKIFLKKPELRKRMKLITKCGIKLTSDKFPERTVGHYDTGSSHIISSVNRSLENFNTDYIDLLLIHRPDHLMDPDDTASAFEQLKKSGKVLNFGVSNFLPSQFEMLQSRLNDRLAVNQVEISPSHLEHLDNGNLDFMIREKVTPMAWSPLGGGSIFSGSGEDSMRLKNALKKTAEEINADSIDKVIYAWLLTHPSGIIPVAGSGRIDRLKAAVDSCELSLSRMQWYEILVASQGHPVP